MSMQLDGTYGAILVGMVVAGVLYGVSCVQAFYYYTNQNDPWYTKLMITTVMILDTVHQALITHSVYTYTVTDWGNQAHLFRIVWSVVIEVLLTGITAFIVQSFLTLRIWRLGRNIYLTSISAMLVVGSFAILIFNVVIPFRFQNLVELAKMKRITIALTILIALTDILIAATLCTLLHTSRTGFHKSEIIINRLIVFTVNTGLLTSLCAVCALIFLLVSSNFVYIAFFFCLGRLYTNTLLATYNARKMIRRIDAAESMDVSFPLRDFHTNGTDQIQNLSIRIDTTTQKSHSSNDQKLAEKRGLPYDEESNKVPYQGHQGFSNPKS